MRHPARFLLSLALGVFLAAACSERESGDTVVSSRHAQIFHSPNCEWAGKIKKSNKRTFPNAEAAMKEGLRPCKVCRHLISDLKPEPPNLEDSQLREFESLN